MESDPASGMGGHSELRCDHDREPSERKVHRTSIKTFGPGDMTIGTTGTTVGLCGGHISIVDPDEAFSKRDDQCERDHFIALGSDWPLSMTPRCKPVLLLSATGRG